MMVRAQKTLVVVLCSSLVLMTLGVVAAGMWMRGKDNTYRMSMMAGAPVDPAQGELVALFDAPSFDLTDQDAKPFSDKALAGKVWIANLMFTTCGSICPMMTAEMATLQQRIPDARVQLVSFSVDPANDTPAVLKKYAAKYKADLTRWHFLTGDTSTVAKGLKLTAQPAEGINPILHSDRFLLIDSVGKVRGVYNSKEADSMTRLVENAATLVERAGGGKP